MPAAISRATRKLMITIRRMLLSLCLPALFLPALAADQQSFCGGPSQFTIPSDLANVEGDLSIEHVAKAPASMTVCAYGYFADKCGDHVTANAIFDKCIAAGYVGAMLWKGLLLEDGHGVEQDSAKAAALFKKAAMSGNSDYATLAKVHYASALFLGKGVARDEIEARKWFQRAADEGDADALTFLRTNYHTAARDQNGAGVGLVSQPVQGLKLERLPPPPVSPIAFWVTFLLGATILAGILKQARPE